MPPKEVFKKYLKEKSIDLRLSFILGYTFIDKLLGKTKINDLKEFLEKHPKIKTPIKEPTKWIHYFKELRNSIAHKYYTQEDFEKLVTNLQYLKKGKLKKFKFDNDYYNTNLTNEEEFKSLLINLFVWLEKVMKRKRLIDNFNKSKS